MDIVIVIICIVLIVISLLKYYKPNIDIVMLEQGRYKVFLWYSNHENERCCKLLWER